MSDLQLVNLTTDGLHRLKVPKAELITRAPVDYLDTVRWGPKRSTASVRM